MTAESACPRCGYCPACGRSNVPSGQWVQPPIYPWWQMQPYTVTVTNDCLSPENINGLALVN
jgi:hypothetical protein